MINLLSGNLRSTNAIIESLNASESNHAKGVSYTVFRLVFWRD